MKEIKYLYMHDMSQILRNIFPSSQFFKKKKKNWSTNHVCKNISTSSNDDIVRRIRIFFLFFGMFNGVEQDDWPWIIMRTKIENY